MSDKRDTSMWPPAALNQNATRPVAVYERGTDRLVAVFPNLNACYTVMPLPVRGTDRWGSLCWEYADIVLD
jgi:hypothetical protein